MKKAFMLAVEIRARQYAELFSLSLLRPDTAAAEIIARPGLWWPGAAVLIAASFLMPNGLLDPAFSLLFAASLALYCRPRAGAFQWALWAELCGYCLLPGLLARLALGLLAVLLKGTMTALMMTFGASALKALSPELNSMGPLIFTLLAVILAASTFATLRLLLTFVRTATKSSWGYALGICALALLSGALFTGLISPLRKVLHG